MTSNCFDSSRKFEVTNLDILRLESLEINDCVVAECGLWRVYKEKTDYTIIIDGEVDIHSEDSLEKTISFLKMKESR